MQVSRRNFYINRRIIIIFLCLSVFIFIGCVKQNEKQANSNNENKQTGSNDEPVYYSLLDGKIISQENKDPFITLMIDNSIGSGLIDSRPVAGINSASIVYEFPVEASITRFMGIFELSNLPEKIGPIRSARPYFAGLAEEYRAIYVHAGGSPQVIDEFKQEKYNIYNLDEISANGNYFWRDNFGIPPFNLYISSNFINKFIQKRNILNYTDFRPWSFRDNKSDEENGVINQIEISEYKVRWQYDNDKKIYFRYQNNKPYLDDENNQVSTINLIVQKMSILVIDTIGRREIKIDGRGTAYIYMYGNKIEGSWIRDDDRTIFYDQDGKEIKFLRGNTWIEIIGGK